MSNDLIRRKAVIELIENCHVLEDAYCLVDYINEMPTAYDVDKVVERLMCESINCHIMTDRAVEIIKSGGIE